MRVRSRDVALMSTDVPLLVVRPAM